MKAINWEGKKQSTSCNGDFLITFQWYKVSVNYSTCTVPRKLPALIDRNVAAWYFLVYATALVLLFFPISLNNTRHNYEYRMWAQYLKLLLRIWDARVEISVRRQAVLTKDLSQVDRSCSRNFNPGPPDNGSGVLTTEIISSTLLKRCVPVQ
jgi:hypothetical protein